MPNKKEIVKLKRYESFCNNIKFRAVEDENDSSKMKFEGYAIVFNQPTIIWKDPDSGVEYKEMIDRQALVGAEVTDVPMRYNHDKSWVLARSRKKTGEGSLLLTIDDYGLRVSGEFVNMTYSRDVYAMMRAAVVDQMSFAFTVRDYSYNSEEHLTIIRGIDKLFDVSVVDTPAYPQTSISALRCSEEAAMEIAAKQKAESLEKEKAEAEKRALELENARQKELEELRRKLRVIDIISK